MRPVVTLLKTAVVGDAAPMIWILFAGMTLLLLIACANAANLFVVRAEQRHREVAVRQALGAQAGQIARLFFIESLVLTTLAATVGIAIARGLVFGVIALVPVALPRMTEISIDAVPVVFAGGLALLMAIFYAVLSGRHHQRTAVSRRVIRDPLLVVQVALALTLLTASALMVKTYLNLSKTDLGFTPDRVLAVEIGLPGSKARQHVQIYQRVVERIRNVPGVESASAASFAPLSGQEHRFPIEAGSSPIAFKFFTPGYFQTMGTTILEGRSFATTDQVSLPYPVLVSAALARRLQADRNVIGTTLRRLSEDGSIPDVSGPVPPFTIAGIVDDVREISLRDGPAAIVYVPLIEPPVELQLVPTNMTLLLRTHVPPLRLVDAVKDAVAASEPALSVGRIGTMDAIVNASRSNETFVGALLLLAAAMALLLGVVGIYGSVAQVVRRRLREISIRLALGARRWDVIWMVAAGALRAIVVGATFGLMVVFAATEMLTALLFGVAPRDPISIFLVIALVMVSGGLAAFAAARHAVRLAPLVVIRGEE
jgi:predicted permease